MARPVRKQRAPVSGPSSYEHPSDYAKYNVAIYARLSVEDNGKSSDSIESQIEYLENFISKDLSMHKAGVFIDNGFTGTNFERPEFQRMVEAARNGEINCVVVKDLSRLGRNYVETGEFLEKICPFIGLRCIAVNDGYDSDVPSNNAQLTASLSNIINDLYAKDISRKVFSALQTKMEKGEYIGDWEKYGYLKDPDNKNKLIVNPETAPVVQQIYQLRSEGLSYSGINRKLNEMGVPSPGQYKANRGIVTNNNQKERKILWNKHIITDILKDITYIGHLAQRKTTQCLHAGIPLQRVEEGSWILAYNTHEAIISQELFDKVQEINRAAAEKAKANHGKYDYLPKEKNIYGSKLMCADCGARLKLHRSFNTGKDKVYFTFNCPSYGEHGSIACSNHAKRKADLDEAVFAAVRAQLNLFMDTAQIVESLLKKKQAVKKDRHRRHNSRLLEKRITSTRAAISALYIDMKDGLLTNEEYLVQKNKYQHQIILLEQQINEFNQEKTESPDDLIGSTHWAMIVKKYADATELSKDLLDACVESIKLHDDGSLAITFRYGQELEKLRNTAERLSEEVA